MFGALWTIWLVLGTKLEEGDVFAVHGEEYRRYQQEAPMLLPICKRTNPKGQ